MKKKTTAPIENPAVKKGYNEKNPNQPHGAFVPASDSHKPLSHAKSNAADKKAKEDTN